MNLIGKDGSTPAKRSLSDWAPISNSMNRTFWGAATTNLPKSGHPRAMLTVLSAPIHVLNDPGDPARSVMPSCGMSGATTYRALGSGRARRSESGMGSGSAVIDMPSPLGAVVQRGQQFLLDQDRRVDAEAS